MNEEHWVIVSTTAGKRESATLVSGSRDSAIRFLEANDWRPVWSPNAVQGYQCEPDYNEDTERWQKDPPHIYGIARILPITTYVA